MGWVALIQHFSTNITAQTSKGSNRFPPLGLLYISSMLRLHGYHVHIIDLLSFNRSLPYLLKKMEKLEKLYKSGPEIIGITTYSENIGDITIASKKMQKLFPQSLIVLGGAHVKADYKEVLKSSSAHIVSLVEGEGHIIEIMKYNEGLINLQSIRGIAYQKDESVEINDRFFIEKLDLLPIPDLKNIQYREYRDIGVIVSSRGCPGRCVFCASRQFSGIKYRAYSAERIFAEMNFFRKYYKISGIGFQDDTFTVLRNRTRRLWEILSNHSDNTFFYTIKSRVDSIEDWILSYLAKTNCISIHIGVESIDNNVLKTIGKLTSAEKNIEAIKKISNYGIRPECSMIIGLPGDTKETILKTILFTHLFRKYYGSDFAAFSLATPYPGTELAINAKQYGLTIKVTDWRRYDLETPICESNEFSLEYLKKIKWRFNNETEELISEIILQMPTLKKAYKTFDQILKTAYKKYFETKRERFLESNNVD